MGGVVGPSGDRLIGVDKKVMLRTDRGSDEEGGGLAESDKAVEIPSRAMFETGNSLEGGTGTGKAGRQFFGLGHRPAWA
ncbi:hypothetical protein SLA2020_150670 [Shorea laevis]